MNPFRSTEFIISFILSTTETQKVTNTVKVKEAYLLKLLLSFPISDVGGPIFYYLEEYVPNTSGVQTLQ